MSWTAVARARRGRAAKGAPSFTAIYVLFTVALVLWGAIAMALSIASGAGLADGARWLLYMLAGAVATIILGLVFGVPRARAKFVPGASERYASNSNLEQISDWLTKLLVGAGLVELGNLTSGLSSMGTYLGAGMKTPNAGALCVASVVYGAGTGFTGAYIWTRLRMRLFLEASDRLAAQAAQEQILTESLLQQNRSFGATETGEALSSAAAMAVQARQGVGNGSIAPILWVDDMPDNNQALIAALRSLDIEVELARSTEEGLRAFDRRSFGMVISDLGRQEGDHYNETAGLELIVAIRAKDRTVPIAIFGTHRAITMTDQLMAAGATLVTSRASLLLEEATRAVTASGR